MTYQPPLQYGQTPPLHKGVSGFGVAALVLGIFSALFAWIPF